MKKIKIKWYQILRLSFQLLYIAGIVAGLMGLHMALAIFLMGSAFISGSWFCGWLCPFGTLQEWVGNLGKKIGIKKIKIPAKLERFLRFSRYLIFAASFAGIFFVFYLSEPYQSVYSLITGNMAYTSILTWVLLGAFILLSLFFDRPYCRYFCSEGARYGLLSLARIFTIKRDEEKCINCAKCSRVCPTQIDVASKKQVRNFQCINCFKCIEACPVKGALKYSFFYTKKPKETVNE